LYQSSGFSWPTVGLTLCCTHVIHMAFALPSSNPGPPTLRRCRTMTSSNRRLIPSSQCSSSADYPWYRDAHSALPKQDQPHPRTNRLAKVTNGKAPEHDVVRQDERDPSSATQDDVPERNNAPADLETSSDATRDSAWPSSIHTGDLPENDLDRFRIHHYFDYVAGTSTGG
jgi:hypothetical protein